MDKCTVAGGKQNLVRSDEKLTVTRQCELLGIKDRTSVYYEPKRPTEAEIEREELIKSRIDYWHTKFCHSGRPTGFPPSQNF